MEEIEIWMPVVGYEGLYEVSNLGRVKSLDRITNNRFGPYKKRGKILSIWCTGRYYTARLCKNGEEDDFGVHQLVAMAFIPNPENKPEVGHWDCDTSNNTLDNLYWCTHEENMNNPFTKEKMSKSNKGKVPWIKGKHHTEESRRKITQSGINNPKKSKKIWQYTKDWILMKEYPSAAEVERQTGISHSLISRVCKDENKTAGGYRWKYAS